MLPTAMRTTNPTRLVQGLLHGVPQNLGPDYERILRYLVSIIVSCILLQENSLSLIVSDLPTNCRAYLQRLTDSKTLLFVIL